MKLALFLLAAALLDAQAVPTNPTAPQSIPTATQPPVTGATTHVHDSGNITTNGANLQTAYNAASCGDQIVLDAGVEYRANFFFNKQCNASNWLQIVSANLASIPVSPYATLTQANNQNSAPAAPTVANFAKLTSGNGSTVVALSDGTTPWKYLYLGGVEVTNTVASPLVALANLTESLISQLGNSAIFDRVYIHGLAASNTVQFTQGIIVAGANVAVVNSYISDIYSTGADSQAILFFGGPGPYLLHNNFLSAAGETLMSGGTGSGGPGFKCTVAASPSPTTTTATVNTCTDQASGAVATPPIGTCVMFTTSGSPPIYTPDDWTCVTNNASGALTFTAIPSPPLAGASHVQWGTNPADFTITQNVFWKDPAWNPASTNYDGVSSNNCTVSASSVTTATLNPCGTPRFYFWQIGTNLTSIVVTANVAVATFSGACGCGDGTGSKIAIEGSSTGALNGNYTLTGATGSTYTFTTSGVSNGTYSNAGLTMTLGTAAGGAALYSPVMYISGQTFQVPLLTAAVVSGNITFAARSAAPATGANRALFGPFRDVKDLLETKTGQRWLIDGNIFQHTWNGGQSMAFNINSTDQGADCPWCIVQDVALTNNLVEDISGAFVLIASQSYAGPAGGPLARVLVKNNLFWPSTNGVVSQWSGYIINGGGGGGGADSVQISHNLLLGGGVFMGLSGGTPYSFTNLAFKDNIIELDQYRMANICVTNPDGTACVNSTLNTNSTSTISNNAVVNSGAINGGQGVSDATLISRYGSYILSTLYDAVGSTNYSGVPFLNYSAVNTNYHNFALTGAGGWRGAASDGTDPGVCFSCLDIALYGAAGPSGAVGISGKAVMSGKAVLP